MIVKTEAVVLHTRKYGDSSKIATIYTKEYGKISIIAKGALKPKNKFGSSLDPLSYSFLTIYKKDKPGLHLVSSSELVVPLRKIHTSPDHIAVGLMMLESVSQTVSENYKNEEIFDIMVNSLSLLNNTKNNPINIFIYFQLNLFRLLGFEINFNNETDILEEPLKFSLSNASITSGGGNNERIIKIRSDHWIFMKSIYMSDDSQVGILDHNFNGFGRIYDFLMNYLSFHLEKPFNLKSRVLLML